MSYLEFQTLIVKDSQGNTIQKPMMDVTIVTFQTLIVKDSQGNDATTASDKYAKEGFKPLSSKTVREI